MENEDPFLWCSLAAGSIAKHQGRLQDSEYVRKLAYALYETAIEVMSDDKAIPPTG